MATATFKSLSLSFPSTIGDTKTATPRHGSLPTLPPRPVHSQSHRLRTSAYYGKVARNVVVMATGDVPTATAPAPTETGDGPTATTPAPTETGDGPTATTPEPEVPVAATYTPEPEVPVAATYTPTESSEDTPEILKTVQEAWDKVDDKYAVSSLAAAGTLALVASTGVISAIDRLPLIPGVLELVGIGYTGWFAYKNLLFTPERNELLNKIKDTYKEISGSS